VYCGFDLAFMLGWATMKCVEATMWSTLCLVAGLSKALTAGVIPNSFRTQAAWRAST